MGRWDKGADHGLSANTGGDAGATSSSLLPKGDTRYREDAVIHTLTQPCSRGRNKEAQEPPASASAAPLGFAAPPEWSDTLCAALPWRVSNSALPPNGSSLATLPAHVR